MWPLRYSYYKIFNVGTVCLCVQIPRVCLGLFWLQKFFHKCDKFYFCSVYRSHVFLQVCFGFERFSTTATVEILTFWFSWLFFIVTRSCNWELEMLGTGLCSFPMWSFTSLCLLNVFLQTFHWKLHLWTCQVDYHRWQDYLFFLVEVCFFLDYKLISIVYKSIFVMLLEIQCLLGCQLLLILLLELLISCYLQMLLYLLLKILEEIYKFTGENFAETYQ